MAPERGLLSGPGAAMLGDSKRNYSARSRGRQPTTVGICVVYAVTQGLLALTETDNVPIGFVGYMPVDAINIFGVSAGCFALLGVVSRRQFRCYRSSSTFLSLVRFPAAPPGKAGQGQKPWPVFFCVNTCFPAFSTTLDVFDDA
jgi:hypothetical protein